MSYEMYRHCKGVFESAIEESMAMPAKRKVGDAPPAAVRTEVTEKKSEDAFSELNLSPIY